MQPFLELSPDQLKSWLVERGYPAYRAAQIRKWVFENRAESFQAMSDLPQKLRDDLTANFSIWTSRIATHRHALDGTEKLLLELTDGGLSLIHI